MEKVICAAIHYNKGKMSHSPKNIKNWRVFFWYRHSNCFWIIACFYAIEEIDHSLVEQWFLTSENRFVDRIEWLKIVLKSWQDLRTNKEFLKTQKILFSEDLY